MALLCGELFNRFQQKRGMPIIAEVEKLLLNAVNGSVTVDIADNPASQNEMYGKDQHLMIQLKMLPNLLRAYNEKVSPKVKWLQAFVRSV